LTRGRTRSIGQRYVVIQGEPELGRPDHDEEQHRQSERELNYGRAPLASGNPFY
jgi:hypothetical protein